VFLPLPTATFISTRHSVSELFKSLPNRLLSKVLGVHSFSGGTGNAFSEIASPLSGNISCSVVLLAVLSTGFGSLSSFGVMGELGVEASL